MFTSTECLFKNSFHDFVVILDGFIRWYSFGIIETVYQHTTVMPNDCDVIIKIPQRILRS